MLVDYKKIANEGMSAEKLANIFLNDYFDGKERSYPINPFQIMTDLGITFLIRPFKKYEGIYIPATDENDFPIVGINLERPITRQRYSAAHELCHHLKDVNTGFACLQNSETNIERYAESFASELLMPSDELCKRVAEYEENGYVDMNAVLFIADYFGVSFLSCLYKIAYRLHKIEGDNNPKSLKKLAQKYKPSSKRREQGMFDDKLYAQVFDAMEKTFDFNPTQYALQKFKNEYIYHDSRLEGIIIDMETVAAIVADLRINKQKSEYCQVTNQNIIEVAGLTLAYDYAFNNCNESISIYDVKSLNSKLFSTAPFPEYGGLYREVNTLVLGAQFEAADYRRITEEMNNINKQIQDVMSNINNMPLSEYIKNIIKIHHQLTIIHPFRDGNGRTTRAFANMMLLRKHISPIFFKESEKDSYKEALKIADTKGSFEMLNEIFFKCILNSFAALSDFTI